ncbi:MAG: TetR/AcrR family transcriptional regulator [Acidobacteriota bacterium]
MSTKTAILESARTLIQTRGVNGMSYEDVSAAVGIRKASIHYHFASKADLVEAVIDRYAERFDEAVVRIMASEAPGAHRLRAFTGLFRQTLEAGDGSICLCGMLAAEISTLDTASRERVRGFFERGAQALASILRTGGEDGSLRPSEDPEGSGLMLFSALEGVLLAARIDGRAERFDELVEPLLDLMKPLNP